MAGMLKSRELPDWPEEPMSEIMHDLVDTHAHPTDYKRFVEEKAEYRDATGHLSLNKV